MPRAPKTRTPTARARIHRSPQYVFGFLDETGALGSARDPFFAVGMLCCKEPYALLRPIQRIRDRQGFYDEIKWNKISAKKLPLLRDLIDVFISCSDAKFSAFVVNKQKHDVIGRFGGPFEAYDALARQLVLGSIRRNSVLWIVADEYSTPPGVRFEENVRDYVNRKARDGQYGRPVAGVCRMRSSGVDVLQLADLLLGAAVYDYKQTQGLVKYRPKLELLHYIKQRTNTPSFVGGHTNARFNVVEYQS
jgi:hypothetical protein